MSKKNQAGGKKSEKNKVVQKTTKAPASNSISAPSRQWLMAAAVALITFITFIPSVHNQFINFDDDMYVYENPLVKSPTLKDIFTKYVGGNYHPLAILSLATDYKIYGLEQINGNTKTSGHQISNTTIAAPATEDYDGTGYHLTALLLHTISVLLLFFLCLNLSREVWVAAITALLFGIHPLHVESVSWISERKDQMYALFYFAALLTYVLYLKRSTGKPLYYTLTLIFFVLSLLSKAQAVTLPVVLVLIDFYNNRKWDWKAIAEKLIFFALSITFGIIAIFAQKGAVHTSEIQLYFSYPERMMFACYALVTYLWKLILPFNLSLFYPYPVKTDGWYPILVYVSPVIVLALTGLIWKYRSNKTLLFGVLFFLANIILLLQLLPVGSAIVADRYSYIAYTGLFYIAAVWINKQLKDNAAYKTIFRAGLCIYFIFFISLTYARTKVWHDNKTMWYDVIDKFPGHDLAYTHLGAAFESDGQMDSAYLYLSKGINMQPQNPEALVSRSYIYILNNLPDSAINDCHRALIYRPDISKAYATLGVVYTTTGKLDSALSNFEQYIRTSSADLAEIYVNIGSIYGMEGKADSAIIIYTKALSLDDQQPDGYLGRGMMLRHKAMVDSTKMDAALQDINKAIALNPNSTEGYYQRSLLYHMKGNYQQELNDASMAKSLGKRIDERYLEQIRMNIKPN